MALGDGEGVLDPCLNQLMIAKLSLPNSVNGAWKRVRFQIYHELIDSRPVFSSGVLRMPDASLRNSKAGVESIPFQNMHFEELHYLETRTGLDLGHDAKKLTDSRIYWWECIEILQSQLPTIIQVFSAFDMCFNPFSST
jgi:hypothetical protein